MTQPQTPDWSFHIENQKTSGQSHQAYCMAHNLKYHSFSYQVQKTNGTGKKFKPRVKSNEFIPVAVKQDTDHHSHDYEIKLPDHTTIMVTRGFVASEFRTLIKTLLRQ
jgi:hypothetical protein